MQINIDENAGFCWGVVQTVEKVENTLNNNDKVHILGEIIHNPQEIKRLSQKGLNTISLKDLDNVDTDAKIIIRAHGEPPETYKKLKDRKFDFIDATCPLVMNLQKKVSKYYQNGYQIIIFGKYDHPEIVGLRGVCENNCVVIQNIDDIENLVDFTKKTAIFSQTTINERDFKNIVELLKPKFHNTEFVVNNSVCRFVTAREINLKEFAKKNEMLIFVAGKNSSNGKSLFNICNSVNSNIHFIESIEELKPEWFKGINSVGITGATSTPLWYLTEVKKHILMHTN